MDDLAAETRQPVSMEFAVRPITTETLDARGGVATTTRFEFHLLQVRPQTSSATDQPIPMTDLGSGSASVLARSEAAFGHLKATLRHTVVLSNEIVERLGRARVSALLAEADRSHRNAYLLVGPDAEEFVVGSSGFESLYNGLSPQAVISLKTPAGIRTLAGCSGSHAADNIERAPVVIQPADRLEPGLRQIVELVMKRLDASGVDARYHDLVVEREVQVELDGNSGRGQIFCQEEPG
jgi:hypothetical protein